MYTLDEYWQNFCSIVSSQFKHIESNTIDGVIKHNVYEYINSGYYGDFKIRLTGDKISPEEITKEWIKLHLGSCGNNEIMEFIKSSYERVKIENLNIFINILAFSRRNGLDYSGILAFELLDIHIKTLNINLYNFGKEYLIFYSPRRGICKKSILEQFREYIIQLNNKKISDLWWIWRDYSGEYSSYIEWLPREVLDDLLMVSNEGEYTPDYTTYVE